jgi:FKBP-type peptidyl-prolyl cis-trans isomerase FklB
MKKIIYFVSALLALTTFSACLDDNNDDDLSKYTDWLNTNTAWLNEQAALKNADGSAYYTKVVPAWDSSQYVLMHYFEDPTANEGNLQPLYTSACEVNYTVRLYDGTLVDSAANFTAALNSGLISGWSIAVMQMHVGDTAQVVMPYNVAYGTTGTTGIDPYSALRFNIRLVDITDYENRP